MASASRFVSGFLWWLVPDRVSYEDGWVMERLRFTREFKLEAVNARLA